MSTPAHRFFGLGYDAAISKELFRWGDTYVIDIPDPANELPCLLIVLAIDAAVAQAQSSS